MRAAKYFARNIVFFLLVIAMVSGSVPTLGRDISSLGWTSIIRAEGLSGVEDLDSYPETNEPDEPGYEDINNPDVPGESNDLEDAKYDDKEIDINPEAPGEMDGVVPIVGTSNLYGYGTPYSPFIIETLDDLLYVRDAVASGLTIGGVSAQSASYILGGDIYVPGDAAFLGIGTAAFPFMGAFDGNGHVVTLNIDTTVEDHVGLFRRLNGATIRNVTVEGSIRGRNNVGGIAGEATNSTTITEATTRAAVTGTTFVGGIVGEIITSSITDSAMRGDTMGSTTGGIAGRVSGSTISSSEVWGSVRGNSNVGGIAGLVTTSGNTSLIENSTVYGNVTRSLGSALTVGGVVGSLSNLSTVRNTFSRSAQVHSGANVFVGTIGNGSAIENSGYFIQGNLTPADAIIVINDQPNPHSEDLIERNADGSFAVLIPVSRAGGSAVTNNQIRTITFMQSGYVTQRIYLSENNQQQRYNLNLGNVVLEPSDVESSIPGEGTAASPFEISTTQQFLFVSSAIGIDGYVRGVPAAQASYVLTADIDISSHNLFFGIGNATHPFRGVFDGGGHVVTLGINTTVEDNVGLFRVLNSATVRNVTVEGSIRGRNNVGGIAGQATNGTAIADVTTHAAVTGSSVVGGAIGLLSGGSVIENARMYNSMTQGSTLGGIAGRINGSTISGSTMFGNIQTNSSFIGGIAGVVSDGTITGSEMWGNVAGNSNIGGIAGSAITTASNTSLIENSMMHGNVTRTSTMWPSVGNAVGSLQGNSVIRNTFSRSMQVLDRTNILVGEITAISVIENSGYFVFGSIMPANANIFIDDQPHSESLIERNADGSFEVVVPVSSAAGSNVVTGNQVRTIAFAQTGYITRRIYLSVNNQQVSYNLNVGSIVLEYYGIENSIQGSGTISSPFEISTAEQLLFVSFAMSMGGQVKGVTAAQASYVLTADIDVSGHNTFFGLGSVMHPFRGVFDGDGHSVTLNINTTAQDNVGLFRVVSEANIRDVTVEGSIRGRNNVGGIAGQAINDTTITDVTTRATVLGSNMIGGTAGILSGNSIIENARMYGNMTQGSTIGGIVGTLTNGVITDSEVRGNVFGSSNVGGIAGHVITTDSFTSTIENSMVYGNITGSVNRGSVVGQLLGTSIIRDTFSRSAQVHGGANIFVGAIADAAVIENSGYFVTGRITPVTANIHIDDQPHSEALIERSADGSFAVLIPVSSTAGSDIVAGNQVRIISFVQAGFVTRRIYLSENDLQLRYQLYVGNVELIGDDTIPRAITGLRTVSRQTEIQLLWDMAFEATVTGYRIYRSLSPDSGFTRIATINSRDILSFTDRNVQRDRYYYYYVVAVNTYGTASPPSVPVQGITGDPVPPILLSILPHTGTTIGRNTNITVRAEDEIGLASITFQYLHNGNWVTVEHRNVSGTSASAVFNLSSIEYDADYKSITIRTIVTNLSGLEAGADNDTQLRMYNLRLVGPSQVQGLNATPSATGVLLRWSDIPDQSFAHFGIEQRDSISGEFRRIGTESRQLGFNVTNLAPYTTYWFRVRAYDNLGNPGPYSSVVQVTTTTDNIPPVVTSIRPAPGFFSSTIPVHVTATDNVAVQSIRIEISTDSQNWLVADDFAVNPSSFVNITRNINISHLPEGSVFVRAFATDTAGNVSNASSVVEHRILRNQPAAPTGVRIEEADHAVTIRWDQPAASDHIRHFRVYRYVSALGESYNPNAFVLVANNVTALAFMDTATSFGQRTYHYRVVAVDLADNPGLPSAVVSGSRLAPGAPPRIVSVSPATGSAAGANTTISVLAHYVGGIASVTAQYSVNGTWRNIGTANVSGNNVESFVARFNWDTTDVPGGITNLRFFATGRDNSRSAYFSVYYDVRNQQPTPPVLTVTPGDWSLTVTWEETDTRDLLGYMLFRSANDGIAHRIASITPTQERIFVDELRNPDTDYSYFIEIVDRFGNRAVSETVTARSINNDTIPPVARAGFDRSVPTGVQVLFDGSASTDNDQIATFHWDFGDGNTANTAIATHVFTNPGVNQVTLTVTDRAGNQDSDTIEVRAILNAHASVLNLHVESSAGVPLPFAHVAYSHGGQDRVTRADYRGIAHIVLELNTSEIIDVSAYARGHLPEASSFRMQPFQETSGTIRLNPGDVAVGEVTHRRLTLAEIEALGVDTNDPSNHHIMHFDVILEFHGHPVRVNFYGNGNTGGFGWGGGGWGWIGGGGGGWGGGGSRGGGGGVLQPIVVPTEDEEVYIIAFLYFSGSASFLKDMFQVSVFIHNMAAEPFTLTDNYVFLNLPSGLSLAPTFDGQSLFQQIGTIPGGGTGAAHWVVRGDNPGSYTVNVVYSGTLHPFFAPISATFVSQTPIIVNDPRDALTLTFFPERGAFAGHDFTVRYQLRNTSGRTLYMVNLTIDGDEINVRELAPGGTINGAVVLRLPYVSVGDPNYEIYFTLMNMIVRSDINVVVMWEGGQPPARRAESGQTSIGSRAFPGELNSHAGDPISLITGNLIWQYTDIQLFGAQNLTFERFYNSLSKANSAMSVGWRHSFLYELRTDGNITTVILPNGFEYFFTRLSTGYAPLNAAYVRLEPFGTGYVFIKHNSARIVFDANGNVAQITDANGNITALTHTNGLLQSVTNMAGTLTFTHTNGRISSIHDNHGRTVSYEHDADGNLIQFTNPDGNYLSFVYDDNHNLVELTDFNGNTFMHNTFENGKVIRQYIQGQGTFYFDFDPANRVTTFTDQNGAVSRHYYDAHYRITRRVDEDGEFAQEFRDGLLMWSRDFLGNTTRFDYDRYGNLTRITYHDGTTETFEHNANRMVTRATARDGAVTTFTYDNRNNLLSITDPLGGVISFTYDNNNNMLTFTDAMGGTTVFTYDINGNRLSATDPLGNTTSFAYDIFGRLISQTQPMGEITTFEYTLAGKLIRIVHPNGSVESFEVNPNGFNTAMTDAMGGVTRLTFDAMNNPLSITDPLGNRTYFEYDLAGNLTRATNALGGITTHTYDNRGRLLSTTDATGSTIHFTYTVMGLLETITDALGNTTTMTYDSMGNLTRQTNPDGTSISFVYDSVGRLISATDEDGNTTSYTYDANGNVLTVTDAEGNITRFEYDRNNRVTAVTDPMGGVTRFTYDANGNLLTITDPLGGVIRHAYNANGNLTSITDPLGNVTSFTYDAMGRVTSTTDAAGNVTHFAFDTLHRMTSFTDPEGNIFNFAFDANGNITSQTDARGNVTAFAHDALNRLHTVTDAAGGTVQHTHDAAGRLTSTVNQMGAETSFTHDSNGRITAITDALGNTTTMTYDSMGRVTSMTDPLGARTNFTYTRRGQLATVTDALGGVTRFEYNALGWLISETNANNETTTFTHDLLGRVTSITDDMGHTQHFTYDANSRIATVTDQNGAVTTYAYDANGNLTSVTDAMGNVTRFEYDRLNRLVRVIGNSGEITIYEYDSRGLVIREINPLGHARVFTHDQNGNLISSTDEDGYVTTFDFDVRNLINTITHADGRSANFTHNAAGQLISMTDWTGETNFTLDLLGRITAVNDQNNRVVSYTFDAVGNQTQIRYPDGVSVTRTFDSLGRITAIQTPDGLFNYTHDPVGRVMSLAMPNGVTETFTHDSIGRLLSITQHNPDGSTEVLNQFTHDPVGNILSRTGNMQVQIPSSTTQNEFNALNQLISSVEQDLQGTSPEGGVCQRQRAARPVSGANDEGNTLSHFEFTYDLRGNMVQSRDVINNTTQTHTFDAANRMVHGINHQGEESLYVFNALGILTARETRTASGVFTNDFVIDYTALVPTVLMEFGSDDIIQRHVYGAMNMGLSRISTTLTNSLHPTQAETFFIQNDHLGTGRFATDAAGVRVAHSLLDEWGNILDRELVTFMGSERNLLNTFTNHMFDDILGLYRAQARFYDPTQRRFISPDPHWNAHNRTRSNEAIQQAGNLYAYALNNPLRFTDPTGLFVVGGGWPPAQTMPPVMHVNAGTTRVNQEARMYVVNQGYMTPFCPASNPFKNWSPAPTVSFFTNPFASQINSPSILNPGSTRENRYFLGVFLLDDFRNNDGSFSLHDSQRFGQTGPFRDQVIRVTASSPDINPLGGQLNLGSVSVTGYYAGWAFEHGTFVPVQLGRASVSAGVDLTNPTENLGASVLASVWSPSGSITIFGIQIGLTVHVGAIGAEAGFVDGEFRLGAAKKGGLSLSVRRR